jgi:hypothetical protein
MRLQVEQGYLITIFVGLCFISAGIYTYVDMGRFLQTAQEASGVVIEVTHESTNKKGRIHPVVRFKTAAGQEIVGRSNEHHNVQPGDTVRLIYDPANPGQIEISTLSRTQNRRLLFTVLSVAFGVFVCLLPFRLFRRRG